MRCIFALTNSSLLSVCLSLVKPFIYILFILCFLGVSQKSLALTAHSINVIIGNKPKVVDIDGASKKHGFTVNGVLYSSNTNNLSDTQINQFDGNLTINDFIIKDYAMNDLDVMANYDDTDGDGIRNNTPFTVEETNYSWFDNKGIKIENNEKIIGCGSGISMPLTLTITTKVKTYSEYGVPNESEYVDITQKYKIMAKPEICYAKPYGMILYPQYVWGSVRPVPYQGSLDCLLSGYAEHEFELSMDENFVDLRETRGWNYDNSRERDSYCGGGYNANVFDPVNGFKVSASPHFPTTGFPGAKFQLIMTGHQDDFEYTFSATPNDSITVDKQGYVMLIKKPIGPVTITAKFKHDEQIPEQNYTFNLTGIWALPQGQIDKVYTYQQVVNMCGGESKLPTRSEMSNSPNAPASWIKYPYKWDAFTRDIGQGLLSEWGMTSKETYPDSNWFTHYFWFYSKDKYLGPYGDNNHLFDRFAIDAWIGQIGVWAYAQQLRGVCIQ
ncbi:hypothetical protein H3T61_01420 [Gilliamella sp. B14384H2]|uniref:hypothetical protein n=1 Tax=unclassified Gilliamella TaxID=2685620 RepID=UPI0018DC9B9E|nr:MULTISPECIES: hypothetical protein [unclassified Gilliamella]MBI0036895.1 hypothetical protein [Gilliamella sp. B14384G10]MBI0039451.1 hypothetical protein [Gilliamella sp. B14384G7]MBI0050890.1 hypothetical protein [Gilliamella sp. B14384G13]MBI0053182.1 hypothetical protein [Gilliamella sp. B14384H2]